MRSLVHVTPATCSPGAAIADSVRKEHNALLHLRVTGFYFLLHNSSNVFRRTHVGRPYLQAMKTVKLNDGPFSGPCATTACGHCRLTYPSDGEVCSDTAPPCRNCPKRLRQR